jgi:hypothetical protein
MVVFNAIKIWFVFIALMDSICLMGLVIVLVLVAQLETALKATGIVPLAIPPAKLV